MTEEPDDVDDLRAPQPSGQVQAETPTAMGGIDGAPGWSYGAFVHDVESGMLQVPLVRESDGKSSLFWLPDSMHVPADIAEMARVVIRAIERSEASEGLGA
jgi:hypothetical protein